MIWLSDTAPKQTKLTDSPDLPCITFTSEWVGLLTIV